MALIIRKLKCLFFRCEPVYQRSAIQILAQFTAQSAAQGGQPTYMLGSPDWFVDVTELVQDWLRIENPYIAALDKQRNLIGLKPGITSLYVGIWIYCQNFWCGIIQNLNSVVIYVTPNLYDCLTWHSKEKQKNFFWSYNESKWGPVLFWALLTSIKRAKHSSINLFLCSAEEWKSYRQTQ